MLKFIKHNMETIVGIEIFPMISFIVFFLFFLIMFVWVLKMDKKTIAALEKLPIEEGKK